jgi:two-component system LytT family sensor kinase
VVAVARFKVPRIGAVGVPNGLLARAGFRRRAFGTDADRAAHRALHLATLAAPPLRGGLTRHAAQRSAKHLRTLLGVRALAITDGRELLAWEGQSDHHASEAVLLVRPTLESAVTHVSGGHEVTCRESDCRIRSAVTTPLFVEERVVGSLIAYATVVTPGLVRATEEVAGWVSAQLELAELESTRARTAEAELRALRAQISPHFIYNALNAIASFVRTDPVRARELLIEFADFTRYSFRRQGDFTTLSDELRNIDRYLLLERARFGDRLSVALRIAPEVLPVAVPFLCLQPLVENAVRHGLDRDSGGRGTIVIVATDAGDECKITVEDNGRGMDPEQLRRTLAGEREGAGRDHVGLSNIDERMRQAFGDDFGLAIETAPGAGTKVSLRVPKYRSGVRAL